MRSDRQSLVEALEAIEHGYTAVATFPVETLSRTEGQALLARLDKIDQKSALLRRRLSGRLLAIGDRRRSA